jgi:tRNA(Arg) A34 adenosine deaminase TadA
LNPSDFLYRAIELASGNVQASRGGPFGAVIVFENQIVAEGTNLVTSTHDPTAHAEVVAIRRACEALANFELHGCTIYASCEPCPMCLGAIYWARLDRLVFAASREDASAAGFDDSLLYQQIPLPPDQRQLPTERIAHPDLRKPFELWAKSLIRIPY